jgi:hypothetical protein
MVPCPPRALPGGHIRSPAAKPDPLMIGAEQQQPSLPVLALSMETAW